MSYNAKYSITSRNAEEPEMVALNF